jgi:hypothetical protein
MSSDAPSAAWSAFFIDGDLLAAATIRRRPAHVTLGEVVAPKQPLTPPTELIPKMEQLIGRRRGAIRVKLCVFTDTSNDDAELAAHKAELTRAMRAAGFQTLVTGSDEATSVDATLTAKAMRVLFKNTAVGTFVFLSHSPHLEAVLTELSDDGRDGYVCTLGGDVTVSPAVRSLLGPSLEAVGGSVIAFQPTDFFGGTFNAVPLPSKRVASTAAVPPSSAPGGRLAEPVMAAPAQQPPIQGNPLHDIDAYLAAGGNTATTGSKPGPGSSATGESLAHASTVSNAGDSLPSSPGQSVSQTTTPQAAAVPMQSTEPEPATQQAAPLQPQQSQSQLQPEQQQQQQPQQQPQQQQQQQQQQPPEQQVQSATQPAPATGAQSPNPPARSNEPPAIDFQLPAGYSAYFDQNYKRYYFVGPNNAPATWLHPSGEQSQARLDAHISKWKSSQALTDASSTSPGPQQQQPAQPAFGQPQLYQPTQQPQVSGSYVNVPKPDKNATQYQQPQQQQPQQQQQQQQQYAPPAQQQQQYVQPASQQFQPQYGQQPQQQQQQQPQNYPSQQPYVQGQQLGGQASTGGYAPQPQYGGATQQGAQQYSGAQQAAAPYGSQQAYQMMPPQQQYPQPQQAPPQGHQELTNTPLPRGWRHFLDPSGREYFVDFNCNPPRTSYQRPPMM